MMKAKYTAIGFGAAGLLLLFYFIVSSLLGGTAFAVSNFIGLWQWMVLLVAGFGIQAGMFFYLKDEMRKNAAMGAAASSGMSSASMVACCAHHIADIAPFLGISALGLFLSKYQTTFLLAGIFSNLLGIAYMMSVMKGGKEKKVVTGAMYALLAIAVIAVAFSYIYISNNQPETGIGEKPQFSQIINEKNDVEFQVTPLSASEFDININTHTVDLDFRLEEISALYDNLGNSYKPLAWEGSPPGGHHRSGILSFPEINKKAGSIRLVISDSAEREFEWRLEDGKEAD